MWRRVGMWMLVIGTLSVLPAPPIACASFSDRQPDEEGTDFGIYVENRSADMVRIYGSRRGVRWRLGSVPAFSTKHVGALCSDFRGRRTDLLVRPLAKRFTRVDGVYVTACSDSVVLVVGSAGPQFSQMQVWP